MHYIIVALPKTHRGESNGISEVWGSCRSTYDGISRRRNRGTRADARPVPGQDTLEIRLAAGTGREETDKIYSLGLPDAARRFCARAAEGAINVRLLWVKFEPAILRNASLWPRALCENVGSRRWLDRLCSTPVDLEGEHYPWRLVFQSIEDAARDDSYRELVAPLQSGTTGDATGFLRLETADGPLILFCRGGPTMCIALFQPRPGLAAGFEFIAPGDRDIQEALAIRGKVLEIIVDLFDPA